VTEAMAYYAAFPNDASKATIALGLLLPSAIVLGGAGLLRVLGGDRRDRSKDGGGDADGWR
jgi:hypothetical protein